MVDRVGLLLGSGVWTMSRELEQFLNTEAEWEGITNKMEEEDSTPNDDKFEKFIWRYGVPVSVDMEGVKV